MSSGVDGQPDRLDADHFSSSALRLVQLAVNERWRRPPSSLSFTHRPAAYHAER
jgi:hypothetical protein